VDPVGDQSDRSGEGTNDQLAENKQEVNSDPEKGHADAGIEVPSGFAQMHTHKVYSTSRVSYLSTDQKERAARNPPQAPERLPPGHGFIPSFVLDVDTAFNLRFPVVLGGQGSTIGFYTDDRHTFVK